MTEMIELKEKLNQHVEAFETFKIEESAKFDRLLSTQQKNTDAIYELTTSVSRLVDDTSAVVQLHKDLTGAARVGKGVQSFMVWCLKWGAIGAAVVSATHYIVNHFNH
jgi:hypothetical protein